MSQFTFLFFALSSSWASVIAFLAAVCLLLKVLMTYLPTLLYLVLLVRLKPQSMECRTVLLPFINIKVQRVERETWNPEREMEMRSPLSIMCLVLSRRF